MRGNFDNSGSIPPSDDRAIVIARFDSGREAEATRSALESMFDDIAEKVTELFECNGGEAHVSEIDKIYTAHGLRNDSGWEQDLPVLVQGLDIAWALPAGAYVEDAENLLWTMGASNVSIHQQATNSEDWRTAPHPMAMTIPEEEEDAPFDIEVDEPVAVVATRKRTLH